MPRIHLSNAILQRSWRRDSRHEPPSKGVPNPKAQLKLDDERIAAKLLEEYGCTGDRHHWTTDPTSL
jgi:hypothetical protein